MTQTQGDLASLSKFIFRAPNWYVSVAFSLLVAALAGVAAFDAGYIFEDAWQGIFYIAIPTVVASLLTTPVDRALGGQLTYNRSSLLALACEVVLVAFLTLAGVVALLSRLDQNFVYDVLTAALALVFAVRFITVLAVSRHHPLVSVVPASLQTVTAAVLLFVYSGTLYFLRVGGPVVNWLLARPEEAPPRIQYLFTPDDFGLLVGMSVLYGLVAYGFLHVLDRPWRRSLGVSGLDFLRGFIGHIAEGSRELEDFFEQMGEDAVVPVTVLSFRRTEDGDRERAAGTEKARFVLPMIHPGPMGEIGGGNLPQRIGETTDGLAFPPHATAGHDFNLVTEREVDTLVAAADRAHERIDYDAAATESVRVESGEAKLVGQAFGDDAFLATTFSPEFADDVEYAVGLAARSEARVAGIDDVLLVDAHNCNNGLDGGDLGHVVPGSRRSFDMIDGAGEVARALTAADRRPVGLGVAWDRTPWSPREGIGPLGIRVAVTEVPDGDGGEHRAAYVLVDGNNMEPGLRDHIVGDLLDRDDLGLAHAEVMTTDTHVVNTVESENQVGGVIDRHQLTELVAEQTADAVDDVEPVEGGMATEMAEVTVFGNDRTETLASHANAVMSIGAALGAVVIAATAVLSVLIFFLTPP